jgi:hypothetical protein
MPSQQNVFNIFLVCEILSRTTSNSAPEGSTCLVYEYDYVVAQVILCLCVSCLFGS